MNVSALPDGATWRHVAGAGMIGGIGFTMSIFITNLAFAGDDALVNASKLAVLAASLLAGILGYLWLKGIRDESAGTREPRSGIEVRPRSLGNEECPHYEFLKTVVS
jgi:NhaA family Na+:H+ antiporter